jgi:outer membrane protein TolC
VKQALAAEARQAVAISIINSKLAVLDAAQGAARAAIKIATRSEHLEKARYEDSRAQFVAGKGDVFPVAQACRRLASAKRSRAEAAAKLVLQSLQRRADLGDLP